MAPPDRVPELRALPGVKSVIKMRNKRPLGRARQGQVRKQEVRDLRNREDEDEVVEQLQRRRPLLAAGRPLEATHMPMAWYPEST